MAREERRRPPRSPALSTPLGSRVVLAPLGGGEQIPSRLLAGQEARYIREQEEAAIEVEERT